jgi:hypothetical protein
MRPLAAVQVLRFAHYLAPYAVVETGVGPPAAGETETTRKRQGAA